VVVLDGAWRGWFLESGGSGAGSGSCSKNWENPSIILYVFVAGSLREQIVVSGGATSESKTLEMGDKDTVCIPEAGGGIGVVGVGGLVLAVVALEVTVFGSVSCWERAGTVLGNASSVVLCVGTCD